MREVQVLISTVKPDVIVVTELFSKSIIPVNIDKNKHKLKGYTCYTGTIKQNIWEVVIHIREEIKSDYCYAF